MVDWLLFLIIEIQINITFKIVIIVRFFQNPSHAYIKIIKTIFSYIKKSINCKIIYVNKKNCLFKTT